MRIACWRVPHPLLLRLRMKSLRVSPPSEMDTQLLKKSVNSTHTQSLFFECMSSLLYICSHCNVIYTCTTIATHQSPPHPEQETEGRRERRQGELRRWRWSSPLDTLTPGRRKKTKLVRNLLFWQSNKLLFCVESSAVVFTEV